MTDILIYLIFGTSIWVLIDAKNLGVKKGCIGGGVLDMGWLGWSFLCLGLWIIGFPAYIAMRPKYKKLRDEDSEK